MRNLKRRTRGRSIRLAILLFLFSAMVTGAAFWRSDNVLANHPVLVEGNCDSPVPGTTLVSPGTCGDFDGDGRIGTAEDTDGADRIFGTINAALGPGTGAAAGTGANHNGTVMIVTSGRFAEVIFIGQNLLGVGQPGATSPGNVTLEAAPGVSAVIDAVLQGDPAGGNATRQANIGINVIYTVNGATRVVTLRNLTVRNFAVGIQTAGTARVVIDNCRVENNIKRGIAVAANSRAVITNSHVTGNGFRIGGPTSTPDPGDGILISQSGQARIYSTTVSHNVNAGVQNETGVITNAVLYQVTAFFNDAGNVIGPWTLCSDIAVCQQ